MTGNDFIEFMHAHRSIRRYTDDPVPESDIRTAVEAGQAASTSSAIQAYGVINVTDPDTRAALAELTGPQEKVARAGAFLIIAGDTRRHRICCTDQGNQYDARVEAFLLAAIDASLFAQNMTLAFEAMGYGICYIGGLRNDLPAVQKIMGFPEGVYPLFGLCVGRPAEAPAPRPRLPVDAVLFNDHYPDDDTMRTTMHTYDDVYRQYLEDRGATPRAWSVAVGGKFTTPQRTSVGPYYTAQGADLT